MPDNKITEPIYQLKVPESKKNKEWYKNIMEYVVPFSNTAVSDYTQMRAAYGLMNNDITIFKESLDILCKPEGEMFATPFEIDKEYAVYNRLYPKVMYMVGEMLKRNDKFDVFLNSDALNKAKKLEFKKEIEKSVDEWIQLQIEMQDLQNQGTSPIELSDYYEKMRSYPEPQVLAESDYKSELEIFFEKVIDYCHHKFKIKRRKALTLKHAIATDRAFAGVIERNGRPEPFVFNILHSGFHKSPNDEQVEKGDYFWYRNAITYAQAYDELKDKVSEEELEKLSTYVGNNRPNKKWDITSGKAQFQHDYSFVQGAREAEDVFEKHVGQSMGTGTNWRYHSERLIWKTYMQFKAYTKTIFLTYIDEMGESITEIVPGNYPIPDDATTVKYKNRYGMDSKRKEWVDVFGNPVYAETLWIPRRHEVIRWGSDIYTDFRECRYQPSSIDNPFDFTLGIKGGFFTSLNSEPISLIERAAPSLMQYIFIKMLQNKELAKYEGYIKNIDASQIPDYLTQDENGEPLYEGVDKMAVWRYYRRKLGDSYFDSNTSGSGLPNPQRTAPVKPEIAGSIVEIMNMQNLLDLVDREMGLQMLVPPQAEGIFQPHSNVHDNQQALNQGYTMAEEFFSRHNEIWEAVIGEYLVQFVAYYRQFFEDNPDTTETFLNYVNSENAKVTIRITPEMLEHEDLGVFVQDTTASDAYRRYMLANVQPLAQNAGEGVEIISNVLMSITRGDSPKDIHKKIMIAAKDQQQRMQAMEEMRSEAEQRAQQHKFREMQVEAELEKDVDDNEYAHKKEIAALDLFKFTQDKNQDQDEIPDYLEALKVIRQLNQKDRELDIKEREANIKAKEANLKKREEDRG